MIPALLCPSCAHLTRSAAQEAEEAGREAAEAAEAEAEAKRLEDLAADAVDEDRERLEASAAARPAVVAPGTS